MEIDKTFLEEQVRDARRYLESEQERLQEKIDTHNSYLKLLDHYDDVLDENNQLRSELEQQQMENDSLHEQLDDEVVVVPTSVTVQAGGINVQQANTVGK